MCKLRVCWSSGVVFTSPSLWSSPSLDSSWCISSNPCEKTSKRRFSHFFSVGCISSDKQIDFLLHIILEQRRRRALRPLVLRSPLLLLRAPRPRQLRVAHRPLPRPTHHRLLRLLHNLLRSQLYRINYKGLTNNLVRSPVCRVADVITDSVLLFSFDRTQIVFLFSSEKRRSGC